MVRRLRATCAGLALLAAWPAAALAQDARDHLLSSVSVSAKGNCEAIDIRFNRPVTLTSQFPAGPGAEIALGIDVLGTDQTIDAPALPREAASVAPGNAAGLRAVTFDAAAQIPGLLLQFDKAMSYDVRRSADAESLTVLVWQGSGPADCNGPPKVDASGSVMTEGKAALSAGDAERAIQLFTKAASSSSGDAKREALESLGLAYERAHRLPLARAQYQAALKLAGTKADTARLKERIQNVAAAMESEAGADLAARKKARLAETPSPAIPAGPSLPVRPPKTDREPVKGWTWDMSGSASQFFYRDDGFGAGLLRGTLPDHELASSDVVSSGDLTLRGQNGTTDATIRIAGYNQTPLDEAGGDTTIATAYAEMRDRLTGLSARVGRQTRSGGGVFGRFDGALLGWQASDHLLLQAVAGSPVYYGEDTPFADERYFLGASLDVFTSGKTLNASVYAITQEAGSVIDRRAVGIDLRYAKGPVTGFAGLDYDVHYGEVNAAYASASFEAAAGLSLYAQADYRHVPFLLTSNALMGQSANTLLDLIDLMGRNDVEMLATDRSATAASVSAGLTYDINPQWQAALDATVADYSGTPASGGVSALPDPGIEYYLTARLSGTNVFKDGDYAGLAVTFIKSDEANTYVGDLMLRTPIDDLWKLAPRLRVAWRDGGSTDQLLIMPSLGLTYQVDEHWSFEGEAAVQWQRTNTPTSSSDSTDLRLMLGYRYAF